MKSISKLMLFFAVLFAAATYADDGVSEKLKKVQMNINSDSYILFEEEALILCDRYNDLYLMEITPAGAMYIKGRKISLDRAQEKYVLEYYETVKQLFNTRNALGAQGVEVGLAGVSLAAEAVGGALELAFSGFDEEAEREFEERIEKEAEKIERQAESMEADAEDYEYLVDKANRVGSKLQRQLEELRAIDLYIEEDAL